MAPKNQTTTGESLLFKQRPVSLSGVSSGQKVRRASTTVKAPEKIPQKIFDYFRIDLKTGAALSDKRREILAQVLMHEIEEGIRTLEFLGQKDRVAILKQKNPKVHLSNLMILMRDWLASEPLRDHTPEIIGQGLKLRNNQEGELYTPLKFGSLAAVTSHGIRYKNRNEDALLIVPERGFIAVCDGMGGHIGGDIASGVLVDFLEYAIKHQYAVEKAIEYANEAMIERAKMDPHLGGKHFMGSTLVCCEIKKEVLKTTHIGDSKLMVIRNGKLIHESEDHTSGQELLREDAIDTETAHSLNHVLSRVMGHDPILACRDLKISEVKLAPKDRVLLASDGITDNFFNAHFSLQELAHLASIGTPTEALHAITKICIDRVERGQLPDGRKAKPDNIALMIYEHR